MDDTIDDWIMAWHNPAVDFERADVPLHRWLGWSWMEYALWVQRGELPKREHVKRKTP